MPLFSLPDGGSFCFVRHFFALHWCFSQRSTPWIRRRILSNFCFHGWNSAACKNFVLSLRTFFCWHSVFSQEIPCEIAISSKESGSGAWKFLNKYIVRMELWKCYSSQKLYYRSRFMSKAEVCSLFNVWLELYNNLCYTFFD